MRVLEIVARAGSLKLTETIERGSDSASPSDPQLSAPPTTGAMITMDVPIVFRTTIYESGAWTAGPHADDS